MFFFYSREYDKKLQHDFSKQLFLATMYLVSFFRSAFFPSRSNNWQNTLNQLSEAKVPDWDYTPEVMLRHGSTGEQPCHCSVEQSLITPAASDSFQPLPF